MVRRGGSVFVLNNEKKTRALSIGANGLAVRTSSQSQSDRDSGRLAASAISHPTIAEKGWRNSAPVGLRCAAKDRFLKNTGGNGNASRATSESVVPFDALSCS